MEKETAKNQLLVIEQANPLEIYNPGNIDTILDKIFDEVKSQKVDMSTDKGRKEIASLAYKVSRSKTFLDDLGKKLGEEAKAKLDAINAERKKIRDRLDVLKDEVRQPLTEWEDAEKNRAASHENELKKIVDLGLSIERDWRSLEVSTIETHIADLNFEERDWEEFKDRAKVEKEKTVAKLETSLSSLIKHKEEQAELVRLRAAEAERLKKEHEERIAREAAQKAKDEAEAIAKRKADEAKAKADAEKLKAQRDAEEAERKAQAAIREKQELEKKIKDAEEHAKKEQAAAVERERQRIEAEKVAAQKAEEKREANKRHSAKINGEVLQAIMAEAGVDQTIAKAVVTAIAMGKVPHTKISY